MIKTFLRALLGSTAAMTPRFVGRARTLDALNPTAFPYRSGAGAPGTVSRSHPVSIEPTQMDPDDPVEGYGRAVVISTANPNTVRQMAAGDTALTKIYGISVRPFPIQQQSGGMSASFGDAVPPTDQPLDVLTSGYILARINGAPVKGGAVYVWVAADDVDNDHYQGGFEAADTPGSTILLADPIATIEFNGPTDADGVGEIRFRI